MGESTGGAGVEPVGGQDRAFVRSQDAVAPSEECADQGTVLAHRERLEPFDVTVGVGADAEIRAVDMRVIPGAGGAGRSAW